MLGGKRDAIKTSIISHFSDNPDHYLSSNRVIRNLLINFSWQGKVPEFQFSFLHCVWHVRIVHSEKFFLYLLYLNLKLLFQFFSRFIYRVIKTHCIKFPIEFQFSYDVCTYIDTTTFNYLSDTNIFIETSFVCINSHIPFFLCIRDFCLYIIFIFRTVSHWHRVENFSYAKNIIYVRSKCIMCLTYILTRPT